MTVPVVPSYINPLPPAPEVTDSVPEFDSKAFPFVEALVDFGSEMNQAAEDTYTNAISATDGADSALISAQYSQEAQLLAVQAKAAAQLAQAGAEAARDDALTNTKGWSPLLRLEADGDRRVAYLYDWVGGAGTEPSVTGYIGPTGVVSDPSLASDLRGAQGLPGVGGDLSQLLAGFDSLNSNPISDADSLLSSIGKAQGQIDLVNTGLTYAGVRAYNGSQTTIRVQDPSGVHAWVRRGSAADNGGTVLKDSVGRSWERVFSGAVSAAWFGASPSLTDNKQPFEAAISYLKGAGGTLEIPPGVYRHSGIDVSDLRFIKIVGIAKSSFGTAGARGVRLVCTSTTANHLSITNPHSVEIKCIQFQCDTSLTPTSGAVIRFISTHPGVGSNLIEDIRIENCFNGILLDTTPTTKVKSAVINGAKGVFAVKAIGSTARVDQLRFEDIIINTHVPGGSSTCVGFDIDTDVHTVWIDRCSALQCRFGYWLHGAIPPEFVRFNGAEAENSSGNGFNIESSAHPWFNNIYATINNGNGVRFGPSFDSTALIISPDVRGNSQSGIAIAGSGGVYIFNPRIGQNSNGFTGTFHGVQVGAGVSNFQIVGGKIGGNINLKGTGSQGRGVLINAGDSNHYKIIGVDLSGNSISPLSDGGTGSEKTIMGNTGVEDFGQKDGFITVVAGSSTGVFAHGYGVVPSHVQVTPITNPGGDVWWVTKNSTQVIVNFPNPVAQDITLDVHVKR